MMSLCYLIEHSYNYSKYQKVYDSSTKVMQMITEQILKRLNSKQNADLSTLAVSPCLTRFHYFSHDLTEVFSNSAFLRKPGKAAQFLVKQYRSTVPFIILVTETATRSCPGVAVLGDYQKSFGKYPLSINLIKVAFFMESFCNHLKKFYDSF